MSGLKPTPEQKQAKSNQVKKDIAVLKRLAASETGNTKRTLENASAFMEQNLDDSKTDIPEATAS